MRQFLGPAGRDINTRFCEPKEGIKKRPKKKKHRLCNQARSKIRPRVKNYFSASDYYLTIEKEEKE